MIRSYFKIAWRNLVKYKLFSFISIVGLAAAMTVCMRALIKIKEAFDYDTFHPNAGLTYHITINLTRHKGEQALLLASSPLPLGVYLQNKYPELWMFSRVQVNVICLPWALSPSPLARGWGEVKRNA